MLALAAVSCLLATTAVADVPPNSGIVAPTGVKLGAALAAADFLAAEFETRCTRFTTKRKGYFVGFAKEKREKKKRKEFASPSNIVPCLPSLQTLLPHFQSYRL